MFLGLRTAIYYIADIEAGKAWYSRVLGYGPYFDEPFYVGYSVGGFELGLHPDDDTVPKGENVLVYWGVNDARSAHARLLELGATLHNDVQDVGEGILVATVKDPWGNVFGVIQNPHFKVEGAR
jgi:lactoylglutathione lyase